jgi:hypothetical protein
LFLFDSVVWEPTVMLLLRNSFIVGIRTEDFSFTDEPFRRKQLKDG